MYSEKFLSFTKQILQFEGGKIDHPNDNGGRTAYGITQKTYDGYRSLRGIKLQDVFLIKYDEVLEIYFRNYYVPLSIETITPLSSAYIMYDFAVNSGTKTANNFKMNLLIREEDPVYLLEKREDFYRYLCEKKPTNKVFLKGWLNRLLGIAKIYQINWKPTA